MIRVVQKLLFIVYPQGHLEDMRTLHHMTIVAYEHKDVLTELINDAAKILVCDEGQDNINLLSMSRRSIELLFHHPL